MKHGTGRQQEVNMNMKRIFIIILTTIILLIIGRAGYRYFGKGEVSITTTPTNSTIIINKTAYPNTGVNGLILPPGSYPIVIKAPGYKTINDIIEIGWKESVRKTYKLNLKSFEQIYKETSNPYDISGREIVQEKFFKNNTWAAAYIMPSDEGDNPGDVIVVVMQKRQNEWRVVLYSDTLPEDAQQKLPGEVYEYIKPFGGTRD